MCGQAEKNVRISSAPIAESVLDLLLYLGL